jgi:hypothetical protein
MFLMKATEDQDQAEKARAEQLIQETPLMNGVDSITVELGEDHTGDPSMWLVFRLQRDLERDESWIGHFTDYAATIQTKILHSGLTRFPYTRLERAA